MRCSYIWPQHQGPGYQTGLCTVQSYTLVPQAITDVGKNRVLLVAKILRWRKSGFILHHQFQITAIQYGMKTIIRVQTFASSVQPLYYASRVFGLAPFSFTSKCVIKGFGIGGKLYATVILITVLSCNILSMVKRVQQPELPTTAVINESLHVGTGAVEAILSILICVTLNGVKSRIIFSKIVKIDKVLLTDSSITYRKTFIFTFVQVIALYSYAAALFTYDIWVWKHTMENISVWLLISGYPHRIVNLGTVVQFSDLVLLLRNRFQALNSKLNFILKQSEGSYREIALFTNLTHNTVSDFAVTETERNVSEPNSMSTIPSVESPQFLNRLRQPRRQISQQATIHKFREIYDDLCDISVLANSMYGLQLLLQIGVSTAELISAVYFILYTILAIQNMTASTISKITGLMTAWLLLTFFKLISITVPCQSATNKVENTVALVQKLLLVERFDQDTIAELQLFSHQLFQRKVKFTAFGFLHLDYSLLFTIIGGATTYLVIVTQYGK